MKTTNITGSELLAIGYGEGRIMGIILHETLPKLTSLSNESTLSLLKKVKDYPENYLEDEVLGKIAQALIESNQPELEETINLRNDVIPYSVYGEDYIEEGARKQMETAMKLPVTIGGSLMPDAHQGYGLPIGGVLATENAVIPYGVGVDIGCRMALSVYDINEDFYLENFHQFKRELIAWTKFGAGAGWQGKYKANHEVLDRKEFNMNSFVKDLHDKASSQLGTSGGGNHFVEFGIIEFEENNEKLNIRKGKYLSLLTHSGSRGFGATIAGHYTRLAKELCKLPSDAANLAYLSLDSAEGQEYWTAMNLAGDYASACHEVIHNRITKAIGGEVLIKVENHHNFAWKEQLNGKEVIVHRKGATPAAKDVLGFIPGSMTAPGFLVSGKGEAKALNSASHGAGRQMSRTKAIKSVTRQEMSTILKDHGVKLIGGGLDEAPMAYKDIYKVMNAQTDLVDIIAKFTPKLVRMADDGSRED